MTTPQGMLKLEPCPFCGSDAQCGNGFSPAEIITYAWCKNTDCPLNSETIFSPEQWNTRAPAGREALDRFSYIRALSDDELKKSRAGACLAGAQDAVAAHENEM